MSFPWLMRSTKSGRPCAGLRRGSPVGTGLLRPRIRRIRHSRRKSSQMRRLGFRALGWMHCQMTSTCLSLLFAKKLPTQPSRLCVTGLCGCYVDKSSIAIDILTLMVWRQKAAVERDGHWIWPAGGVPVRREWIFLWSSPNDITSDAVLGIKLGSTDQESVAMILAQESESQCLGWFWRIFHQNSLRKNKDKNENLTGKTACRLLDVRLF